MIVSVTFFCQSCKYNTQKDEGRNLWLMRLEIVGLSTKELSMLIHVRCESKRPAISIRS